MGDVLQGQSRDMASTITPLVKEGTFKPWSVACHVCGLSTTSESLSTPRPSGHKLTSTTPDILPDLGYSFFSRCLHLTVVLSLHWILLSLMLNCLCVSGDPHPPKAVSQNVKKGEREAWSLGWNTGELGSMKGCLLFKGWLCPARKLPAFLASCRSPESPQLGAIGWLAPEGVELADLVGKMKPLVVVFWQQSLPELWTPWSEPVVPIPSCQEGHPQSSRLPSDSMGHGDVTNTQFRL